MCGIFGYTGEKYSAANLILQGLKKLEYRGYDSWGVAVEAKGGLKLIKHAGQIGNAKVDKLPPSNFGLGHTRWATHGQVTDINAHPHFDCSGKIAVVHNGIIDNYQDIKNLLGNRHKIISQTDTELAAHLIEEYHQHYLFPEAVRRAFLKFTGLSALLIADGYTKTLVAVKTGSPLVIGLGQKENIIGSDANCLLSLSRRLIFLEDNQLAQITADSVKLFAAKTGRPIQPKIHLATWKETLATKQHFPHFMLKEISEQPRVLNNIIHNFPERISHFARLFNRFPKIYLVGCGSAYHAALAGTYFMATVSKKEAIPILGSEFNSKQSFLDKHSLVVFLSQSGETIDIIEPLKITKEKGIKTAALVNVFGSSLYRLADEKIWLEAGPEICVLSTKAFTAKLAVLGLLSFALAGKLNQGKSLLLKTRQEILGFLKPNYQKQYLDPLAKLLSTHHDIFVIGRGISYPIALEAALKIKEVSYLHAEGLAGGELKHGPLALIEANTPCLVLNPADETKAEIISNALEIKARKGSIIGLTQENRDIFDTCLPVTYTGPFTTISYSVVAQLLAYKIALLRGCDPDKPRNLAKSVTVK